MSKRWTKSELQNSALLLTVQQDGSYKWASDKTHEQIAGMLRGIANEIESEGAEQ